MTAWLMAHWLPVCVVAVVLGVLWLAVLTVREVRPPRRRRRTGDSPCTDTGWGGPSTLTLSPSPSPADVHRTGGHAPGPVLRPVRVPQCPACGFFDVVVTPETHEVSVVMCAGCGAATPWSVRGPWPATIGPITS